MKLEIKKIDGTGSGKKLDLAKDVFAVEPHDHSIWLTVRAELAHKRQGNAQAKNRSAVRGGGRKPWRQKGRGAARAGTIRSPLWKGGGQIFPPSKREYRFRVNKKVKKLARKSALTYKMKEKKIHLVEDFKIDKPKTKKMFEILKGLGLDGNRVLWILS